MTATDADPRCEHCDLPLAQCVHGAPRPEPTAYLRVGPTITARTTSPCVDCGDDMREGSRITHTEDGWVHARHVAPPVDQFEGF